MRSLRGQLLISAGGLYDRNFRHTVVLLAAHDEQGAVGIILNRPMELRVVEATPRLAELTGPDAVLYEGGPVAQQEAVLLVESEDHDMLDVHAFGDIGFLTGDVSADVLDSIRRARVYLGYAGWGPGQLEAELEASAWILELARAEDVFSDDARSLWQRVLQRKGPPYTTMARIPFDPSTN